MPHRCLSMTQNMLHSFAFNFPMHSPILWRVVFHPFSTTLDKCLPELLTSNKWLLAIVGLEHKGSQEKSCQHFSCQANRKIQCLKEYPQIKRAHCWTETSVNLQFNYVRMPKKLQILNLSADFPHHIKAANLLSVQDLHCYFVSCQLMFPNYKEKRRENLARFISTI